MKQDGSSKFRAVSSRRLTEEIADQVERLILSHDLLVGDALPPERTLADQMGVSRNILREAISMLTQKGLLEVRPGTGTFVISPGSEFLSDTLVNFINFSDTGLKDVVEARRSLEVEIAGLAAERATAEDIRKIKELISAMDEAGSDVDIYVESDVGFHEALASAADNEILKLLMQSFRRVLRENILVLVKNHPTARTESMQFHKQIARAVAKKNREEAQRAMRGHLESITSHLAELSETKRPGRRSK
jgi:GntR family transcriptional repressor for pyruvate dehydrogenase complex